MEDWISLHANLLSGLAAIVTLVIAFASPMFKHGISALRKTPAREPAIAAAAAAADIQRLMAMAKGPASIAVMPFHSLSPDASDTYLADGITCELISALNRAGQLQIAPRADCFALRDTRMTVSEIGQRLRVRYVVTGSLRRTTDKVRVIAEFSEASSGRALWTKTYDRELADILAVQEDIAGSVAAALGGETYRAEIINLQPSTDNLDAWSLTQRARHDYMVAHGPAAIKEALKLARKAVELDTDYALAHALFASLLMDGVSTGAADDPEASRREARTAIERALALAGNQSEILMYAGRVWVELGERVKSVEALRRGTQISPYDLMEWGFLARSLAFGSTDEAGEAEAIAKRIVAVAPDHPNEWTWELFQGQACMNLERYE